MAELLVWTTLILVLALAGIAAWVSYRRHSRRAADRSRAALNRLLAEADEIEQAARQSTGDDEPPTIGVDP